VRHDGVDALVQAPAARSAARAGLARQDVVGREHDRPPARQQWTSRRLGREPLEVHDVRPRARRGGSQHAGHVLGQAGGGARPLIRAAGAAR